MYQPTIRLGKTPEGKLIVNKDSKLCLGCCDMTGSCDQPINSLCPACYRWNIPESVTVNLSGLTLADEPQYWLDGNNATPSGTVTWCNHIWDGMRIFNFSSIDGSYVVPLNPHQGYSAYICSGTVEVPFEGTVADYYAVREGGEELCNSTPGDLMRICNITTIIISVGASYVESEPPYEHYQLTVDISIGGNGECDGDYYNYYYQLPDGYSVFRGTSDPIPAIPEKDRIGFNAEGISNTYDTPYQCTVYGGAPCWYVDFVPSWGGTVNLSQSGALYQFPVHIELFGPDLNFYPSNLYGWQVWTRLYLNTDALPHETSLRVKYEVSYDGGVYIGEACGSQTYGYYLQLPLLVGQYPGYVTMEILSIYCDSAHNVFWDKDSDESPSILTGVFNG